MDVWAVGATLAILGMGGTLLSLFLLSLLVDVLKRAFPYQPDAEP